MRTVSASSSGVAGTALEAGLTGPAISIATTSAPLAANSTAIARPMPRAAPVTTATLPFSMEPRPGRTGPALLLAGGSGTLSPSSVSGPVSVCVARPEVVWAEAAPLNARPAAARLVPNTNSCGPGRAWCCLRPCSSGCLLRCPDRTRCIDAGLRTLAWTLRREERPSFSRKRSRKPLSPLSPEAETPGFREHPKSKSFLVLFSKKNRLLPCLQARGARFSRPSCSTSFGSTAPA